MVTIRNGQHRSRCILVRPFVCGRVTRLSVTFGVRATETEAKPLLALCTSFILCITVAQGSPVGQAEELTERCCCGNAIRGVVEGYKAGSVCEKRVRLTILISKASISSKRLRRETTRHVAIVQGLKLRSGL